VKTLTERLAAHTPQALVKGTRRAAVLVPIIDDGGPRRLLLTRRSEALSTHKGQVAFPGGIIDPTDIDATDAALREAQEEVGLPRSHVEVLGFLDDLPAQGASTVVTPVVGRVRSLPTLVPEPGEVASIFYIPLDELRRRSRWRVKALQWRNETWPVYYFDHEGETLWGLSALITLQLLKFTPEGSPFDLAELARLRL
jgi:8-oxo-dGTP pyrophosphatase MutT (NUDIX family)